MGNRFLNGEAHQRQRRRNAIFLLFQYSFVMGLLIGFLVHISRCSFLVEINSSSCCKTLENKESFVEHAHSIYSW